MALLKPADRSWHNSVDYAITCRTAIQWCNGVNVLTSICKFVNHALQASTSQFPANTMLVQVSFTHQHNFHSFCMYSILHVVSALSVSHFRTVTYLFTFHIPKTQDIPFTQQNSERTSFYYYRTYKNLLVN